MNRDEITSSGAGTWTFDERVSDCFDDMLSRSIPDLLTMRDLSARLALAHLPSFGAGSVGRVLDLGCSLGGALRPLLDAGHHAVGVDDSAPMLDRLSERERLRLASGSLKLHQHDLRAPLPEGVGAGFDVVQAVLALCFLPVRRRRALLFEMAQRCAQFGALILVEKIEPRAQFSGLLYDTHHKLKREAGYSEEQIKTKERALEGVLVPLTEGFLLESLDEIGFEGDCFWRALNFAGFIAKRKRWP